ncbi:HIT family protein [Candidatus Woesearchaeota archaeon]|nr:HIT family protein [Candidatus Woesearchaeota archaeon]
MSDCQICKIAKNEIKVKKIYEDNIIFALIPEDAAMSGHIRVFPKAHKETIEELDYELITQMLFCANYGATAVFEGLGAEGTNIIIKNGEVADQKDSHICIDVLPRKSEDGLNFQWEPKQLSPEDMDKVKEQIKDHTAFIGKQKPQPEQKKEDSIKKKHLEGLKKVDEENYLTRKLIRIP